MGSIIIVDDNPSLVVKQLTTEHNALVVALQASAISGDVAAINTISLIV